MAVRDDGGLDWDYSSYGWIMPSVCCTQSCPTLCNPVDCSPPGSSVHGILQVRILEWIGISYPRGSLPHQERTPISCISCIGRWILYYSETWEAHMPPATPQRYVEVLTPGTGECGFTSEIKLKWDRTGLGWALVQMTDIFIKRRKLEQRQTERILWWQRQILEWGSCKLGNTSATRRSSEARKESPLQVTDGAWLYQHLDFRHLTSETIRQHICCFKLPTVCQFGMASPRKWVQWWRWAGVAWR